MTDGNRKAKRRGDEITGKREPEFCSHGSFTGWTSGHSQKLLEQSQCRGDMSCVCRKDLVFSI